MTDLALTNVDKSWNLQFIASTLNMGSYGQITDSPLAIFAFFTDKSPIYAREVFVPFAKIADLPPAILAFF